MKVKRIDCTQKLVNVNEDLFNAHIERIDTEDNHLKFTTHILDNVKMYLYNNVLIGTETLNEFTRTERNHDNYDDTDVVYALSERLILCA